MLGRPGNIGSEAFLLILGWPRRVDLVVSVTRYVLCTVCVFSMSATWVESCFLSGVRLLCVHNHYVAIGVGTTLVQVWYYSGIVCGVSGWIP